MGDIIEMLAIRTRGRKTTRLNAYFDNGSPHTFICEDVAEKVGQVWELSEPKRFHGMGNGKFLSRKAILLDIMLRGYPCYQMAFVVSRSVIDDDLLIGHDFMQKYNIGLDPKRRKIVLDTMSLKRAQKIRRVDHRAAVEQCPHCLRPFKSMTDYPVVRLVAFEELPIPEVVDRFSDEAGMRQVEMRKKGMPASRVMEAGIVLTPEISEALKTPAVREFFGRLEKTVGRMVKPEAIWPPFAADHYFQYAHPIPGTRFYLKIEESEEGTGGHRKANVIILSEGPNFGSGGGPSLQFWDPVASITYDGVLTAGTVGR